jgi:hypothetical protein
MVETKEERGESMSAEEAKKLIEQGLRSLQEGLAELVDAVDDLENPDRPAPGSLQAQIKESVDKTRK